MKDKIDLFAKGVFSYEKPELIVSIDNPVITIESGKIYRGSFCVSVSTHVPVRGVVYSSSGLLTFDERSFSEADNTIHFSFDATYLDRDDQDLDRNDRLKGRISVVTEFGEAFIPFRAVIRPAVCETSIGPASDLFHYASLAQTNREEAEALFVSDTFRKTFSMSDPRLDTLCRGLQHSSNVSMALEEMLVASRKKKAVELTSDRQLLTYDNTGEIITDSIVLKKDSWGYLSVSVETEGDFLTAGTDIITADMFMGNVCELFFKIDPDKLHRGSNFGCIRLRSARQTTEVKMVVRNPEKELKSLLTRRRMKHFEMRTMNNLLEYLMGRLPAPKFVLEAEPILDSIRTFREETLYDRLFRIYLMHVAGRNNQGSMALSVIEEDEDWQNMEPVCYALVIALRAVFDDDVRGQSDTVTRLRELAERESDPMIFMLACLLDKRRRIGFSVRYDMLKRLHERRTPACLVLLEAVNTVNDEPTVLRELGEFDLQVINFGLKYNILGRNAVQQTAYIAMRSHRTTDLTVRVLKRAFDRYKLNEILEPLCSHLIMEGRTDNSVYNWMSIGVLEQLRVRDLCETCLKSAGEALDRPLPKQLLTYFQDGSQLDDDMRTALYANTVLFNTAGEVIHYGLSAQMRNFACRMLAEGRISKGLAVLYDRLLKAEDVHGSMISKLPDVLFKHVLTIESATDVSIVVVHKELETEQVCPVIAHEAFVDIFTEEPVIFAVDRNGERRVLDNAAPRQLITNPGLWRLCEAQCHDDERVALHSLENARYRGSGDDTIGMVRRCADIPMLEKRFAMSCYRELIEYFYDNDEGDLMESYLVRMDLAELDRGSRARMIELMILRDLYSAAMDNIVRFGITGVDVKRLSRLATELIEEDSVQTHSACFLDMCELVFRKKRHTNVILDFLVRCYEGDTESMHEIWSAARDAGIDTSVIEEKLLTVLLFTESDMSYSSDVFRHYYSKSNHGPLTRAFLAYYAYGYVAYDRLPEEEMLSIMRREVAYEDVDVCTLAVLKNLAGQNNYSDEDRTFIEEQLERLHRRGILMPFFKDFGGGIRIPSSMLDKCYVEYHTDPRKHVLIHYCMLGSGSTGNYIVEPMKDVGFGIFIKEFVLFYGEALQYYISEETEEGSVITEASELTQGPELNGSEDSRYHQLNLMITAREMNDSKTMYKLMENYIRTEYLCRKLFHPIR